MTLQQENCVALSVALHRFASHDLRRCPEGEGSVAVGSSEGKQALDIGSFQYSRGNEESLAPLQGLDCVSFFGSPTWAPTRDLRINRRSVGSGCRPRQGSLSGGQDFQYFRVGLFDFHRARAPDRLLDIGKLSASNAWLLGCAVSGSRHGRRQLHAPLARQIDDVRVRPGPAPLRTFAEPACRPQSCRLTARAVYELGCLADHPGK
jgi:hypothetical protein